MASGHTLCSSFYIGNVSMSSPPCSLPLSPCSSLASIASSEPHAYTHSTLVLYDVWHAGSNACCSRPQPDDKWIYSLCVSLCNVPRNVSSSYILILSLHSLHALSSIMRDACDALLAASNITVHWDSDASEQLAPPCDAGAQNKHSRILGCAQPHVYVCM